VPIAPHPSLHDTSVVDRTERVEHEDGLARTRRTAMIEYLQVGSVAGAAVFAAPYRARIDPPGVLPQARPDGGRDRTVVPDL